MSADEDPVAWLRAQVETDLSRYRAIAEHLGPLVAECNARPDLSGSYGITVNRAELARAREGAARCEAELAILDLHAAAQALVGKPPLAGAGDKEAMRLRLHALMTGLPDGPATASLISVRDHEDAKRELAVLEPVVRLLASGYKHRPGYPERWSATPG